MPWNDNANPGPWGSPPSSHDESPPPERRPPAPPPPPQGPDFADVLKRARDEWSRLMRGRRAERLAARLAGLAAAGLAALWILSGFYLVQPGEAAIVFRLGAPARIDGPGMRFHWPAPIGRADLVEVGGDQKLAIGGDGAAAGLMSTSDDNLVDVAFAVHYRVADPAAWLFKARDPDMALKTAAMSAVREAVGQSPMSALLGDGRQAMQARALARLQSILSSEPIGVTVAAVKIQSAAPPAAVADAWQDVTRANQEAQSATNAANAYTDKTVGQAQAQSAKIADDAAAYQQQVVHEANGEASRFDQIYAQYRRAPAVTRERLYIQTMQDVLAHARTVIIGAKGAQIVLAPPASPGAAPSAQPAAPPSTASSGNPS